MGDPVLRMRERLSKFSGRPKKVRITRGYPGEPRHNGFVLGVGRSLVLLHQFHDFYPEGFTVLRLEDVLSVRHDENERFWERMFRSEGILDRVGIPYEVPLDDLRTLLQALSERKLHVILECEKPNPEESGFYIGRLVSVGRKAVSLLYFDPLGRWDEKPDVISYETITKVQFDTPYINTLSKYLKKPEKV
jgi:hypothetical protein